jgi:GntR family transcriptional regulator, transcriptional repressor for pyruvate dehydrogenase complex
VTETTEFTTVEAPSRRRDWKKPARLYEEVARDLANAITEGQIALGSFLPTEQELAREYRASRNVVREAVKLLSARGFVEVLHGRGSRVLPRHRWQLLDQLVHLVREDRQVPTDLLELRRILEVEISGLAAARARPEQIAAMEETIAAMAAAADRPEECIDQDILFHRLLADAAANALLPLVLEPVGQLLRASRVATIHNPGAVERSIAAHRAILDRVEAHQADAAREAMRGHLLQVEGEILRMQGQAVDGRGVR